MATPKGMRAVQVPIGPTEAVHVYSNDQEIWLQIRRNIPTEQNIESPSFKVALRLTPQTARLLGLELLRQAEQKTERKTAKKSPRPHEKTQPTATKSVAAKPVAAKPVTAQPASSALVKRCPKCKEPTIEHEGREWCADCGGFTTARMVYPPPPVKAVKTGKPVILDLISTPEKPVRAVSKAKSETASGNSMPPRT